MNEYVLNDLMREIIEKKYNSNRTAFARAIDVKRQTVQPFRLN